MNNKDYIERVRPILNSSDGDIDVVEKIYTLTLPEKENPLITLIHGDSQELEDSTTYAQRYDPANPSEDEIAELRNNLAKKIVNKISKYLADWDAENYYHYSFGLKATYGAFKNEQGGVEYIDIIKRNLDVKTIPDAVRAAKEWQSMLLERVTLYPKQEIGHKKISVKPIYMILDTNLNIIASGALEFDNERSVSTWLNQA